jgi:HAD superfamily hydrolase (TIGR01549 family)
VSAVLFDFGGTLVDQAAFLAGGRDAAIRALQAAYGRAGLPADCRPAFDRINSEVWIEHAGTDPRKKEMLIKRETIRRFIEYLGDPPQEEIIDAAIDALVLGAAESDCVFDGTREVLEGLAVDCKLAIVSNGFAAYTWRFLERHGLDRFFPVKLISEETGIEKPDPRVFRMALDRLREKSERAVMVGNMLYEDMQGAQNAGIRSIWINRGEPQSRTDIRPDHEISDLRALVPLLRQGNGRAVFVTGERTS